MLGLAFQDDATDLEAAIAEFISELDEFAGAGSGVRGQKPDRLAAKRDEPKPVQPRRQKAQAHRPKSRPRRRRPFRENIASGVEHGQVEATAQAEIDALRLYAANLGHAAGFEIAEDGGNP